MQYLVSSSVYLKFGDGPNLCRGKKYMLVAHLFFCLKNRNKKKILTWIIL